MPHSFTDHMQQRKLADTYIAIVMQARHAHSMSAVYIKPVRRAQRLEFAWVLGISMVVDDLRTKAPFIQNILATYFVSINGN